MLDAGYIIAGMSTAIIILGFELAEAKFRNYRLGQLAEQALENSTRMDKRMREVSKIHQELLNRPVNVVMSPEAVNSIGNTIVSYLEAHRPQ